jgi:hypothetical protein
LSLSTYRCSGTSDALIRFRGASRLVAILSTASVRGTSWGDIYRNDRSPPV